MKYWRGYLTAVIFAGFSYLMMELAKRYQTLLDMVYPYVTRSVQVFLADWTGSIDACLWQILVVLFVVAALATLVMTILFKGSVIQWFGWVTAVVSMVFFLHTVTYGLNYYNGPIEDDLRLEMVDYTQSELEAATKFYQEQANALAELVQRDENGNLVYPEFEVLAEQTGAGFRTLMLEKSFSVLAGSDTPVKKLGWADMYSSMGITGFTCFLTGEAAVNPQIPVQSLPFTMCHEMAHRRCIAREDEANFAAFLGCEANESVEYRYSGYFMAYRYCYNALASADAEAAAEMAQGCSEKLIADTESYRTFFLEHRDETATKIGDTVNDTYLKASGDEEGIASYGAVCDYLVNWYLSEYAEPPEEVVKFDPFDPTQVDLSGIVNALPAETEPAA